MKTNESPGDFVAIHAPDSRDASAPIPMRASVRAQKRGERVAPALHNEFATQ
jgi:hypothetical protein